MRWPADPALLVIRAIAWLTVTIYAAVLVFIVAYLVTEEGAGDTRTAALIAAAMALNLVAFGWGLAIWKGRRAWLARLFGWTGMLLGTVPLISFSFVLLPLVLAASPTLLRWREPQAVTSPDRTVP